MPSHFLLTGGHVVDPRNGIDGVCDVLIESGVIKKIGKSIKAEKVKTINCKGKVVTPGLIDMHVHLREPGREDKETIENGLRAAIAGGVTHVLSMPNTIPVTDNQTVVRFQLEKAGQLGLARLSVAGRTTTKGRLSEMWELKQAGAIAVTDDGEDVNDECLLQHALEWAKTFDLPLMTHAEICCLGHAGVMHEGKTSQLLGLPGQIRTTEVLAIQRSILLAEEVGARLHICHISTEGAVEAIRAAQQRGVNVTAEVSPQHLCMTDEECLGWNTFAKMHPPLREEKDVKALQQAVADGIVTVIATDHAPHLLSEKLLPFELAPVGTVGLETAYAVMNTYLVEPGILSLSTVIERMTAGPADALGLEGGTLSVGAPADVSVFDPALEWTVDPSQFHTKGKNSVFTGRKLKGKATDVFVGGRHLLNNGTLG